jgi:hypothetical protein
MLRPFLVLLLVMFSTASAHADIIHIFNYINAEGQPSVTQVGGELQYDPVTSLFRVELINKTSPSVQLCNITGFLFNIAKDGFFATLYPNPTYSPDSADAFYDVAGPEAADPFGTFEFGAAFRKNSADGDWLGGGNGSLGIANGQTGEFFFKVVDSFGVAAGSRLVSMDFMSEFSTPNNGNLEPAAFVVRVKSLTRFSEKVSIVPVPVSALGGMSLFGIIALLTKRRSILPITG